MKVAFWVSFLAVAYTYIGYPTLMYVLSLFFLLPYRIDEEAHALPGVSLIIAAYNEERVIEAKLRNSLALDYLPEKSFSRATSPEAKFSTIWTLWISRCFLTPTISAPLSFFSSTCP